jgi:hypothetical protein
VWDIVEEPPYEVYDQDALTALLTRQDGVISRDQALAQLTEKAVRHRLATGRWRRVHRGVFVTYTGPITDKQRNWIAVLAVPPDDRADEFGRGHPAYLGGLSALIHRGLRGVTSSRVHVLIPHRRQIAMPPFAVVHRVRDLPAVDCEPGDRLPATRPARSVVDGAQWARSANEARLIIVTSLQQRLITERDIGDVLDRCPTPFRRELIVRTTEDAAGGSHSLGEIDFIALCRKGGLPLPTRQRRRRDSRGRWRYLDACFDRWMVAAEVDGAHHANVGQMWDDHERQNALELAGYTVLRYPAWVVREQPQLVLDQLRRALVARGWKP